MKIAIFGSTGLLGSNLCRLYKNHDLKSFSRSSNTNNDANNYMIDFNNLFDETSKHFENWSPDIIINCVALVNLQNCETDISLAKSINCDIAVFLAKIAKKFDSYYIHISTDHYFNDNKRLHTEIDTVKLLNNYALTKYVAENEILKINSNSLIVRTNIVGFRRTANESFFEWLINSLINKKEISLFTNYYTSPLCVNLLGDILLKCYNSRIVGLYNIASREVIDKYNFGFKTAKKFNLDFEYVNKSYIENKENSLNRALTLGLDVSKIQKDLGIDMPSIDDTLNSLYKEFIKGKEDE